MSFYLKKVYQFKQCKVWLIECVKQYGFLHVNLSTFNSFLSFRCYETKPNTRIQGRSSDWHIPISFMTND